MVTVPEPSRPGGRTPAPSPADAVAALARQVERLEAKVEGLATVRRDLHGLAGTVAGLANELAELVEAPTASDEPAPSWLWPVEHTDGAEAAAILAQLIRWARRVHLRYVDAALPECWLWHPDVIEELTWLRASWHAAYHGPAASAQRAGDWHDRLRPGVVRRIRSAAGSCSLREHLGPAAAPTVPAAEAAPAIAAWWAAPSTAAPTPTGEQIQAADASHRSSAGHRPAPADAGGWR